MLHSRGFSRRTLLAAQGAQALLYAAVAFPLGLLLGLGLAKLAGRFNGEQLPRVEFPARLNDGAIWLGLAVALVGALVLLALSQDHRVDRRATSFASERAIAEITPCEQRTTSDRFASRFSVARGL